MPVSLPAQPPRRLRQDPAPRPGRTDPAVVRNFCIIAHIDHGKSTLADRMLQLTGVLEGRDMRAQYLDRMDIERERGITIKSQAVRLPWTARRPGYVLNLIHTPGHVDFCYEVSRTLAACEGAVPLVRRPGHRGADAGQPVMALEADLKIIPVLNKIDLPAASARPVRRRDRRISAATLREVLRVSAKTGEGVGSCCTRSSADPGPGWHPHAPARGLIFDSVYDTYRGVVTYVRVVDGRLFQARAQPDDVHRGRPRDARSGGDLPGTQPSEGLAAR